MTDTTDIRMTIALRLYKAREMSGLSQEQVAKMIGASRSLIKQIESGNQEVSAKEISRFANIYRVADSWLLGKCEYQLSEAEAKKLTKKLKPKDLDTLSVIIASIRGEKK